MDILTRIPRVLIFAVLIVLLVLILKAPIKLFFKLLINTVAGFITLFVINFIGSYFDFSIAVNWVNAIIVGILGIPGVALVLILKYLAVF